MAIARIGVLGSGPVGQVLADGCLRHGYEVMRGSRDPGKLAAWQQGAGPKASTGTFEEAARFGEVVVLAVKGTAAEALIGDLRGGTLDGKTVIDTTNAIAPSPPVNGVIALFTGPNESLMERLQGLAPKARFVKAFSCVGNALMVNPDLGGEKPTMFMCGNDAGAKAQTQEILAQFGWEWEDLGMVEAARAIEPLVVLWCIPGFLRNDWARAYRVLRK
jgi:predicted dinucleotide-binding enzyme